MINFFFILAIKASELKNDAMLDVNQTNNGNYGVLLDISGSFGQGLSYSIQDVTLTISGSGVIGPCDDLNACPYKQYNETIENIIIEEGITIISNFAFNYFEKLRSVSLPESAT